MHLPNKYLAAIPLATPEEYARLRDGMKKHGYDKHHPIVLYNKRIVDGRARYRAATELKIKPAFIDFEKVAGNRDLRTYILHQNLNRRALSPSPNRSCPRRAIP